MDRGTYRPGGAGHNDAENGRLRVYEDIAGIEQQPAHPYGVSEAVAEDRQQGLYQSELTTISRKPIDVEEMLLRIKALLRRADSCGERSVIGDVVLDYDRLIRSRKRRGPGTAAEGVHAPVQTSFHIPAGFSPGYSLWTKYGGQ